MATQSFEKHTRIVPLYHMVLFLLILLSLVGACVNLYQSLGDHQRIYSASLIVTTLVALLMTMLFARTFPLRAQDRAIRAEENLRHFVLTGKLLDPSITIQQVIALRFASDAEFPHLAQRAAKDRMAPKEIKRAVQNWREDNYRV